MVSYFISCILSCFLDFKHIPKTYSWLTDDNNENKKAKATKKSVIKLKLKFEDYKNFVEVNQPEKEINYLEKNKLAVDRLRENRKEFIKKKINIKITTKI